MATDPSPADSLTLVREFNELYAVSLEYCRPHWEMYGRLWQLWHNKRIPELDSTIAKIMVGLGHAAVQDRLPKLVENVFSSEDFISLRADNPRYEPHVRSNEFWLRDLLLDKIKLRSSIHSTLQDTLIGGTGYRMPLVTYKRDGKSWRPVIRSKPVEFFHVLPGPTGGQVNPIDDDASAVPWLMIVDWWPEDKIKAMAEKGKLFNRGVGRMISSEDEKSRGTEAFPEDEFRNKYSVVGNIQYGGPADWRAKMNGVRNVKKTYRICHWIQRDRHIIIGEDAYLLADIPRTPLRNGFFPLVKYQTCTAGQDWFGISYLEMLEDIIKAVILNLNYRMDHLLGVMFPVTWIRRDIQQHYTAEDFVPRPNDVKFFPNSVRNISEAIFYDRRPDVSQDTFLGEDRLRAMLQKVAGQTETTASMGDVVGNKTATGVTAILNELTGRPNMESLILESTGLREEATLLLTLADEHFNQKDGTTEFVQIPGEENVRWTEVDPVNITDRFTVQTHGTRMLAEKNTSFQKLLAMYPFWSQSPATDIYELNKQSAEVADVLPDPDRVFRQPQPLEQTGGPPGSEPGQPGGMASSMDVNQAAQAPGNQPSVDPQALTGATAL